MGLPNDFGIKFGRMARFWAKILLKGWAKLINFLPIDNKILTIGKIKLLFSKKKMRTLAQLLFLISFI